jgi:hypothetical protein
MNGNLLATVLELARLGAVGIGAIVLLLAFFLLVRGRAFGAEKAKLISRFMTLGFIFGITAGVLGLVPLFVAKGGPIPMRLNFAPDFADEKLTPPIIRLPDGKLIQPDERVMLNPSSDTQVVTINVAKALQQVKSLADTAKSLTQSVANVTQQRDALANQVSSSSASPTAVGPQTVQSQGVQTQQLQTEVAKSIQSGDFARANAFSMQLHRSVVATKPAIAEIVTPH